MLQFAEDVLGPRIKVIGVGGGGGNSVNTMIEAGIQGVDFVAANTDCQVLDTNQAPVKIQLGKSLTKGLGAGANPEIGCAAALEDAARIAEVLAGADMVFVTAGMGGGTGTGAAPVIAQVARDMGALTVGVVTKPFAFEGLQRKKKANAGISELGKAVDALIVIPNDRLVAIAGHKLTLRESFAMVDNVCLNAVRGISDLVMVPGLINVDFADVRTIMTGMGRALMGTGRGTGDKRAIDAAQMAINSPLLEDVSINGATGILVNITGGPDLTLAEVNEACSLIQEAADPDANIIFGSVIDSLLADEVRLTVIATGFQPHAEAVAPGAGAGTMIRNGRRHEHQIALPMQPASHVPTARFPAAALELGELADDGYPQPYPPVTTTVSYPPVSPMPLTASGTIGAGVAAYPTADWASEGRPIIRPAVGSTMGAGAGLSASDRRRTPMMPALAVEELGIEESEFDKPTYLRRGLASHGDPGPR
jgi:cell division protein FtsZ